MNGRKLDIDAVMFDLDGTLIDSIGIYYKIVDVVFAKLGLPPVSREKIIEATRDGDFDWDVVLPPGTRERRDEIAAGAVGIISDIYPRMFGNDLNLIPGADAILKEIASTGMKIGIVTSTPKEGMHFKLQALKQAGVEKLPSVIITADDVQHKKPAADPLVACAHMLGTALNRSAYVGDMRSDIRAGKAAGVKTIGVLTGFDDYESLRNEHPDFIIKSVDNLRDAIAFPFKERVNGFPPR